METRQDQELMLTNVDNDDNGITLPTSVKARECLQKRMDMSGYLDFFNPFFSIFKEKSQPKITHKSKITYKLFIVGNRAEIHVDHVRARYKRNIVSAAEILMALSAAPGTKIQFKHSFKKKKLTMRFTFSIPQEEVEALFKRLRFIANVKSYFKKDGGSRLVLSLMSTHENYEEVVEALQEKISTSKLSAEEQNQLNDYLIAPLVLGEPVIYQSIPSHLSEEDDMQKQDANVANNDNHPTISSASSQNVENNDSVLSDEASNSTQKKKQNRHKLKTGQLKTRNEAIDYILNKKEGSVSEIFRNYLSVFDTKTHKVYIGEQCAEIHFNRVTSFDEAMYKIWRGPSTFIRLLEPNKQFDCECSYDDKIVDDEKIVIRFKFKNDVETQEINNFILRLRFPNFIKSNKSKLKLATKTILVWMKAGCDVDALMEKIIEQAEDKNLTRTTINNYFLKQINYSNLSQENSIAVKQRDGVLSDESHSTRKKKKYPFKLFTREEAIKYLESRNTLDSKAQKKYSNDLLNNFFWLFQQEKHELTIGQRRAKIRVNIVGFSDSTVNKISAGLGALLCILVPEQNNFKFKYSTHRDNVDLNFKFKKGVNPERINNIIRMVNFVKFAKDNLKFNFDRIHELFSLMINRTDIFKALREELEKKNPNNKEILDRIKYYFSESIDPKNSPSVSEGNNVPGPIHSDILGNSSDSKASSPGPAVPIEPPPSSSLEPLVEEASVKIDELDSAEITQMEALPAPSNESQVENENMEVWLGDVSNNDLAGVLSLNKAFAEELHQEITEQTPTTEDLIDLPDPLLEKRMELYELFQVNSLDAYKTHGFVHNGFAEVATQSTGQTVGRPSKRMRLSDDEGGN